MAALAENRRRSRPSPYSFTPTPYSSHRLLFNLFPEEGRGRTVLDVGCGQGYLGEILAARGYEVTGVERPGIVNRERFAKHVELVEADLDFGLPRLGATFDYVLLADVLEHLRDPENLLLDLRQVLSPGGRIVASLPNSGNLYFRLNVLIGRIPQDNKGLFDRTHLRFFTWRGWSDLLASAGYTIESSGVTAIPVGLRFPQLTGTLPVRAAERFCYDLARLWKKLFAYQFLVVARPDESGPGDNGDNGR